MNASRTEVYGDGDEAVIIEFIPAEDVPEEFRKDNKVFVPGTQAIVMSSAEDSSTKL